MGDLCRMINYYYYFKSTDDSRCYIFDDICDVVSNDYHTSTQSIIYYKSYNESCMDYPLDWVDSIGDDCDIYKAYNWCKNGNVLRDKSEFENLIDSKYGLSAMDSCCECDGGVVVTDNVAFSIDENWINHILCNYTSDAETPMVRQWDNLFLYQLCGHLDIDVNCAFLVDSQWSSHNHSFSMHLCNVTPTQITEHNFQFIVELNINNASSMYDMYINLLWFDIDPSLYSANINIIYENYSQCIGHMTTDKHASHNGIHPCYSLLQPTHDPSSQPTQDPSLQPTYEQSSQPTQDPSFKLFQTATSDHPPSDPSPHVHETVIMVCVGFCIMFAVFLFLHRRSSNKQLAKTEEIAKKVERSLLTMTPLVDGKNTTNEMIDPSAPPLDGQEKEDLLATQCLICCDNAANMFNDPCGHVTYCHDCAVDCSHQDNKCPNCRQVIQCKQIYPGGFVNN
eukprot:90879_1